MKTALMWFRRDLRVYDNTAFLRAAAAAETIIPVFIVEEAFRTGRDVGAIRLQFLFDSLRVLQNSLAELGYPLVVRHGRSETEIPKLCREIEAQAVFCNKRPEPYAQARDSRVFNALNSLGIGFEQFKDAVLWEEQEILTQAGQPYTVFTPYSKAWKARTPLSPGGKIKPQKPLNFEVASDPIPGAEELGHPLAIAALPAGEEVGQKLARDFFRKKIQHYADTRDLPAQDGTSRFSAHLRAGTLSIRMLAAAIRRERDQADADGRASCDTFLNELIWREFYHQILHNFPHVMRGAFRPEYDRLAWSTNEDHFAAWKSGQTGYPIVDAAMRCLKATGWMHNRLRMIVAMFLTKDLLLNWQRGEAWFMDQLVDGDLAANNGGWQWSAGSGTDAAPYFRIFNPVTQSQKFDPEGSFIRRWIPELADCSAKEIHAPWDHSPPKSYPARIVRHEEQRPKALAMYAALKRLAPT